MCWKQNKYPAGSEVEVMDAADQNFLGIGKLKHPYDQESEDNEMPEIEMPNGKIIYGYECWWIPVAETRPILDNHFKRLLAAYHSATGFLSNLNKAAEHPTYTKLLEFCQKIGAVRIVPVIAAYLQQTPDWLYTLLHQILNDGPEIPEEARGKINDINDIWLGWLKEKGHYKP